MKKELILLAGLHKTGTTSIQRACKQNKEILERYAYSYPLIKVQTVSGLNQNKTPENHSRLINQMFSDHRLQVGSTNHADRIPNTIKEDARKIFLQQLESQPSTILLVAERISTLKAHELIDLRDWFEQQGFHITLLCCIRKPLSWVSSMIGQRVCGLTGPRLRIEDVIQEFLKADSLVVDRIKNIINAFPSAEFYSFEDAASHKFGPPGYFLERLGLDLDQINVAERLNEGRSGHSVRINSIVNDVFGHRLASEKTVAFHAQLPTKYPALFTIPGEKFTLQEGEVAPLHETLARENEWLKEKFGKGYYDDEVSVGSDQSLLDDAAREFLKKHFVAAGPRIKKIIEEYLATH